MFLHGDNIENMHAGVSLQSILGCFSELTFREPFCNLTLFLLFNLVSQFFWMRLKAGSQQTFSEITVFVLVWLQRCFFCCVFICFICNLSLFFLFSGLQLVCQCQETIEEHGETARPELGAQDQAVQQICSGQCRETQRQQWWQLLRRYSSSTL